MTASSTPTYVRTTRAISRARWLAAVGMLGAAIQVAGGILESVDRVLVGDPRFTTRTAIMGIAYLLFLATLVSIELTGVTMHAGVSRAGLHATGLGWILYAVAQFALPTNTSLAERVLFPIGTVLIGVGMLMAGIAATRARPWSGWRRYVLVLCGAFPFLVIFPTFALTGEPNFLVLSAWGACWLALGVALWTDRSDENHRGHREPEPDRRPLADPHGLQP